MQKCGILTMNVPTEERHQTRQDEVVYCLEKKLRHNMVAGHDDEMFCNIFLLHF